MLLTSLSRCHRRLSSVSYELGQSLVLLLRIISLLSPTGALFFKYLLKMCFVFVIFKFSIMQKQHIPVDR